MSSRKSMRITILLVLSVSIIMASLTSIILMNHYSYTQYQLIDELCQKIVKIQPEMEQTILEVVKEQKDQKKIQTKKSILSAYGYQQSDFMNDSAQIYPLLFGGGGIAAGAVLFLIAFLYRKHSEVFRINKMTDYLEKINHGEQGILCETSDDDFSRLQDEMYKTVTSLYQTREAALLAKKRFADNLSNIAHQLKTKLTAISLTMQMMKEHPAPEYPIQIQRQLDSLIHLEESLLLLSRIDSGTLALEKNRVDVFTLLTLAYENIQGLFLQAGVKCDIPESGEVEITADLDWSMEAIINLLKNCMEYAPRDSTVHCTYESNPLYVRIRIWDEGNGFLEKEIPYLFTRYFRGANASAKGIGIGLALSKEIFEMQNGIISARNLSDGGACFELRIYSH